MTHDDLVYPLLVSYRCFPLHPRLLELILVLSNKGSVRTVLKVLTLLINIFTYCSSIPGLSEVLITTQIINNNSCKIPVLLLTNEIRMSLKREFIIKSGYTFLFLIVTLSKSLHGFGLSHHSPSTSKD